MVERANIGKSTFYEHYRSKDELLGAMMGRMLGDLASAATGRASESSLHFLMAHFWENRRLGRTVFGPLMTGPIRRRLATLIDTAGGSDPGGSGPSPHAVRIAAGQVGLLHAWLSGECVATNEEMAALLAGSANSAG